MRFLCKESNSYPNYIILLAFCILQRATYRQKYPLIIGIGNYHYLYQSAQQALRWDQLYQLSTSGRTALLQALQYVAQSESRL